VTAASIGEWGVYLERMIAWKLALQLLGLNPKIHPKKIYMNRMGTLKVGWWWEFSLESRWGNLG